MCGIVGYIDYSKETSVDTLIKMRTTLKHRGDDDSGEYTSINDIYSVGLGHQRLSILDLSTDAVQPMKFDNLTIVFNGEVYNFKELREHLFSMGYSFSTTSDTEVVLKLFHRYGESSINMLNGMFAIAVYDEIKDLLFLIRDRIGIKPLYYANFESLFLFSSELKAFSEHPYFLNNKRVSPEALFNYFQYGFIPGPLSIFENVYKVIPGSYIKFKLKQRKREVIEYWNPRTFYQTPEIFLLNEDDALNKLRGLLIDSVSRQLVADVPVGVFLSGGVDSSLISAIANSKVQNLNTFSIGFDNAKYNEADHAKKIANFLGTNHHELYLNQKSCIDILANIPYYYDEPLDDNSVIPTTLLCNFVKNKATVVLSGDGGDELFAGYKGTLDFYRLYKQISIIPAFLRYPLSKSVEAFSKLVFGSNISSKYKFSKLVEILNTTNISEFGNAYSKGFPASLIQSILVDANYSTKKTNYYPDDNLDNIYLNDLYTILPEQLLTKVDRASMSTALEVRVPLLDHRIIEFSMGLNESHKVKNNIPKYILRELLYKYIPKEVVEKPKMGFTFPYWMWMKSDLKELILTFVSEQNLKDDEHINYKKLINYRDLYYKDMVPHHMLWRIFIYSIWRSKWM